MKQFSKIVLVSVLGLVFAAFLLANAEAPSSPNAPSSPANANANSAATQTQSASSSESTESDLPPQAAPVLFHLGPFPITNSIVCSWIVAAVILIIVRAATWKNIKEIPSGLQNVIEALVEGWEGLMGDILDPRTRLAAGL